MDMTPSITPGGRIHLTQAVNHHSRLVGKAGDAATSISETSPRPLPSCLAPRLKTGTDLVKKQEVMKSGLGQPNRVFSPSDPQNSSTPSFTQIRKPPLPPRPKWNWLFKGGCDSRYLATACHGEGINTAKKPQKRPRWMDVLRKHPTLPFPQGGFL